MIHHARIRSVEAGVRVLKVGSATHAGNVRETNEDSLCALIGGESPPGADALLAVADGVGGHVAGEVASRLAVQRLIAELFVSLGSAVDASGPGRLSGLLERAIAGSNAFVHRASASEGRQGMGSTLTVALVVGMTAVIGHVGDSRAYLLRGGTMRQLTRDHTWVAQQIAAGGLTEAQATRHPRRNVLTRALGTAPTVKVDTEVVGLAEGDDLLLCSDGIYGLLDDQEMAKIIASLGTQEACDHLVSRANEEGGHDNSTAVVLLVGQRSDDPAGSDR